jgi:hypothetical protein
MMALGVDELKMVNHSGVYGIAMSYVINKTNEAAISLCSIS